MNRLDAPDRLWMFSAPASIAYAVAIFVAATIPTLVTPLLVDVWREAFGWSEADLGLIAGLELGGFALGALSALYWQKRWDWRWVAASGLIVMAAANAACAIIDMLPLMATARLLCGVGAGIVSGVHLAFVANTRSAGRIVAIVTLSQLLAQAGVFLLSEPLAASVGGGGLYQLMAAATGICLFGLRLLPTGWPSGPADLAEEEAPTLARRRWPFLLAFIPYGAFQAGLFTFLGLFGAQGAGLDAHAVSKAIGVSVVGGALGPVAAYVLDRRAGLRLPIAVSILVQAIALFFLLMTHYEAWLFLVYISLLQAGWTFLCCYLYVVLIDAAPELTAASIPLTALSSAIGAYGAGVMLELYGNSGLLVGAIMMLGVIAALTCPFLPSARACFRSNAAAV